jgi:hypothetical protein
MAGLAAGPFTPGGWLPVPGKAIPQRSTIGFSVDWASLASAEMQGNRTREDNSRPGTGTLSSR